TDVHHPPVGVSRTRGWIENDLARRVRPTGELHAQDLAGSALECRVRNVRVDPLDDDSFDHGLAWGTNHRRGYVCGRIQTRKILVVRHAGPGERSFLVVHRVKLPVPSVIRVEHKAVQPDAVSLFEAEPVEHAWASVSTV